MLQAVDELDDAIGALRHVVMGWSGELRLAVTGAAAAYTVWAALLRSVS